MKVSTLKSERTSTPSGSWIHVSEYVYCMYSKLHLASYLICFRPHQSDSLGFFFQKERGRGRNDGTNKMLLMTSV